MSQDFAPQDRLVYAVLIVKDQPATPGSLCCGLATFDSLLRQLSVCEYTDSSTAQFGTTEAMLVQIHPERIAVGYKSTSSASAALKDSVSYACGGCPVILNPASCDDGLGKDFDASRVEAQLNRLILKNEHCDLRQHAALFRSDMCMRALSVLLIEYALLSDKSNHGAISLQELDTGCDSLMRVDRSVVDVLHVFPANKARSSNNKDSDNLFGLVNRRCSSKPGSRKLMQWLTKPLSRPGEISERHDVVEHLIRSPSLMELLCRHRFPGMIDLEVFRLKLMQCVATGRNSAADGSNVVSADDLFDAYRTVLVCRRVVEDLRGDKTGKTSNTNSTTSCPAVESLASSLLVACDQAENFLSLVENCLDPTSEGEKTLDPKFDPALRELADERSILNGEIEQERARVQKLVGVDSVRLVESPLTRELCFRVVRREAPKIQGIGSFKQVALNKAEYLFTNDRMKGLATKLLAVNDKYSSISSKILLKVLQVAATYTWVLARICDLCSTLDVLCAFAQLATSFGLSRPRLATARTQVIKLQGAFHLIVDAMLRTSGQPGAVRNDCLMYRQNQLAENLHVANNLHAAGNSESTISGTHADRSLLLLTGPNMGGKSTYIRTVAQCVLLNQIGSFIPAEAGSELTCFRALFTRVGASDCSSRGLSTFMQEMVEASYILRNADSHSLVLIDELGRGTATEDGLALASAISYELYSHIGCLSLFATHFHELRHLPFATNLHIEASVRGSDVSLSYKVKEGACTESFGLSVAKIAGFPMHVVEYAENELLARS